MEMQAVLALVIGVIVVLFVPALVWSTVVSGLFQTIREKLGGSIEPASEKASVKAE